MNDEHQEITRLMDSRLMAAAQMKADRMAALDFFAHQDPHTGIWPNDMVRMCGYELPADYEDDANQVESIARGYSSPGEALKALRKSDTHHDHIVGAGFWSDHYNFGVGYAERELNTYYVIITAPDEKKEHKQFMPLVRACHWDETIGPEPEPEVEIIYERWF